jgi:LPXTG-motif cell wall-anchored protein
MMRRSAFRAGAVAIGVLGLSGAGALAAAVPASAAPSCAATTPAATLISSTVCEIRISATGSYTFPTSIAKLSAILIGAGGGGENWGPDFLGYGGDGGALAYVDTVPLGTPVAITVGDGGIAGTYDIDTNTSAPAATPGGATSLDANSATGGQEGYSDGSFDGRGAGGTSEGDATGLQLSALTGVDPVLFASGLETTEYSRGGIGYNLGDPVADPPTPTTAPTIAGSGGHGLLNTTPFAASAGADGLVILRFAAVDEVPVAPAGPSAPTLPDTGFDATPGVIAAGALLAVGGLAFLWGRRRRRSAD